VNGPVLLVGDLFFESPSFWSVLRAFYVVLCCAVLCRRRTKSVAGVLPRSGRTTLQQPAVRCVRRMQLGHNSSSVLHSPSMHSPPHTLL
jgi:hypothetical protein